MRSVAQKPVEKPAGRAPSRLNRAPGQAPRRRQARQARNTRDRVETQGRAGERPNATPINFAQNFGAKSGGLDLGEGGRLRKGDSGDQVTQLQEMLNSRGARLSVDGDFGPNTQRALRKFQRQNKIEPDGVVGPTTLGKLNGPPAAPASPATGAKQVPGGATPAAPAAGRANPATLGGDKASPAAALKEAGSPGAGRAGSFADALDRGAQGQKTDLGRLRTLSEARTDGKDLYFKAGAAIDVDGSGPSHGDPYKQWQTSLNLKGGGYPNADKVPYFVLPPQVAKQYGAKVGDLGLIRRGDQVIPAVFADVGPKKKIGELSRYAAQQLGIPASPISGGTDKGVEYMVFPGSRGANRPTAADITPEALQARVQELLAQRQ